MSTHPPPNPVWGLSSRFPSPTHRPRSFPMLRLRVLSDSPVRSPRQHVVYDPSVSPQSSTDSPSPRPPLPSLGKPRPNRSDTLSVHHSKHGDTKGMETEMIFLLKGSFRSIVRSCPQERHVWSRSRFLPRIGKALTQESTDDFIYDENVGQSPDTSCFILWRQVVGV